MKSWRIPLGGTLLIAFALALISGALAEGLAEENGSAQLSEEGRRVVDYLLDDWSKQFRSTSIPLAMENLGIEPDDALRLEIVDHFRDNDGLATNLQWWGANNYLFSNEEKRLAKYLVYQREKESHAPTVAQAAAALEVDERFVRERLPFMARAGFLAEDPEAPLGYSLAPGYKRWAGPLQHNFHTVMVEGERPFDVW